MLIINTKTLLNWLKHLNYSDFLGYFIKHNAENVLLRGIWDLNRCGYFLAPCYASF